MAGNFLKIYDLFMLGDGITVIACDKPTVDHTWSDRKVSIVSNDGEKRQELTIRGLRSMLRQGVRHNQIAVETQMPVQLTAQEAQSGRWLIEA